MYPKNKTPCVCFTTFVCAIHRWAFDLVYNGHNHHLLFNFLSTHLSALWWWNSDIFGHKGSLTVLNMAFIAVSKSNLKNLANNSKNCTECRVSYHACIIYSNEKNSRFNIRDGWNHVCIIYYFSTFLQCRKHHFANKCTISIIQNLSIAF